MEVSGGKIALCCRCLENSWGQQELELEFKRWVKEGTHQAGGRKRTFQFYKEVTFLFQLCYKLLEAAPLKKPHCFSSLLQPFCSV
jgi:hypothetical protein